jgi:hypothetical protein
VQAYADNHGAGAPSSFAFDPHLSLFVAPFFTPCTQPSVLGFSSIFFVLFCVVSFPALLGTSCLI